MEILNVAQMRHLEDNLFQKKKFPESIVIENVGMRCADVIFQYIQERPQLEHVCILAGKGNNAADGVAAARHLHNAGISVEVIYLFDQKQFSSELARQHQYAIDFEIPFCFVSSSEPEEEIMLDEPDTLFVDAIFGIGLNAALPAHVQRITQALNLSGSTVVAIDIASGINADTGCDLGNALWVDLTIAVAYPKLGHFLGDGLVATGALIVIDAGINLTDDFICNTSLVDYDSIPLEFLANRNPFSHKHEFGNLLVIGGSQGMNGAPVLSAMAAQKCGVGLVTIATLDENFVSLDHKAPAAIMTKQLSQITDFNHYSAILVGPGFGIGEKQANVLRNLLSSFNNDLIIDADGLNNIAKYKIDLEEFNGSLILTPHIGEFLRLANLDSEQFFTDPYQHLKSSFENNTFGMIVKNACSYIKSDDHIYFFNRPNDVLATAGSGDVLAGILGALCAQNPGADLGLKMISAVAIHSMTGEVCSDESVLKSINAHDLIDAIPDAIFEMERE